MQKQPLTQEPRKAPRAVHRGVRAWWRRRSEAMRTTIVSGMVAIFVAVVSLAVPPVFKSLSPSPSPAVRLASLVVQDPDGDVVSMEFTIHNTGGRRGIVEEALFTVEDMISVHPCTGGGMVELSAEYDLLLPFDAEEGDRLTVPVSQQVGPDEADRFAINARLDEAAGETIKLFRLDVKLIVDGAAEDIEAGTVVFPLSDSPADEWIMYWGGEQTIVNQQYIAQQGAEGSVGIEECLDENTQMLHDFLQAPGEHSPSLERIAGELEL
jgi:hypothetical protein